MRALSAGWHDIPGGPGGFRRSVSWPASGRRRHERRTPTAKHGLAAVPKRLGGRTHAARIRLSAQARVIAKRPSPVLGVRRLEVPVEDQWAQVDAACDCDSVQRTSVSQSVGCHRLIRLGKTSPVTAFACATGSRRGDQAGLRPMA